MKKKKRLKKWVQEALMFLLAFAICAIFLLLLALRVNEINKNIETCGYNYCGK